MRMHEGIFLIQFLNEYLNSALTAMMVTQTILIQSTRR
jgi:hypothetical protein